MKTHELKCDPIPFGYLKSGIKKSEVRKDDRDYQVGDTLLIREYVAKKYYGEILAEITHIQRGYGLPEEIAVLSLNPIAYRDNADGTWTIGKKWD